MPTVRPKVATCTVAGWRLFSVNHTGWLSKRGADTAAAETLAEVDGSDPILLTMEAEMFWQKAVISARTGPDTREATTVGKRLSS